MENNVASDLTGFLNLLGLNGKNMINSLKKLSMGLKIIIGTLLIGIILLVGNSFIFHRRTVTAALPTSTATATLAPMMTSTPTATLSPTATPTATVAVYTYTIVNTYPHDPNAFTQGLIYTDNILYEGTGLNGRSSLRKVDLETGQVITQYNLPAQFFGEGITIFKDKIFQLTWQNGLGFVYDKNSFQLQRQFNYPTEGWGITTDGQRLIMSDGSATLYFWNPDTMAEIGRIVVSDRGQPIARLNELEYINGEIYANIWQTNFIIRLNPQNGQVVGWISLAGLLKPEDYTQPVDVLNGIAYDAEHDRLFITGKWWPKLFEIKLMLNSSDKVFLPIIGN